MIREKPETVPLQKESEVPDRRVGGQQLLVKGGIFRLCGGELPGEKGEGLPITSFQLLQNATHVGIGSVHCQGEEDIGRWV